MDNEFTAKAALKALVEKSNPVEWRAALDKLIDLLPSTGAGDGDMNSADVAGAMLQGLTAETPKKNTNYRSIE